MRIEDKLREMSGVEGLEVILKYRKDATFAITALTPSGRVHKRECGGWPLKEDKNDVWILAQTIRQQAALDRLQEQMQQQQSEYTRIQNSLADKLKKQCLAS